MRQFVAYIQRVVDETGLSPTEIANRARIAASTINRPFYHPEKHETVPSLRTISKIVAATGVPYDASASVTVAPAPLEEVRAKPLSGQPINLSALPYDLPVYLLHAIVPPSPGRIEGYAMQEDAVEFCRRPPGLGGARNAYATYAPSSALAKLDEGDVILVAPERPARAGDAVLLTVRAAPGAAPVTYLGRLVARDAEWVELGVDRPAPMRDRFAAATVVSLHKVLTTREIVGL